MLPADIRLLELELRHALKPKYARDPKKDAVDHLRVAMVRSQCFHTVKYSL